MRIRALLIVCLVVASSLLALPAQAASTTFNPVADTYVDASAPTATNGSKIYIKVDHSPILNSYLRFEVEGVGSTSSAILRLYAETSSSTGLTVHRVSDTGWEEGQVTYNNAPSIGSPIGSTGSFSGGKWLTIDVSSVVKGDGSYAFALTTPSSTAIKLTSSEGTNKPQLLVPASASPSPYMVSKVGTSYQADSPSSGTTFTGTLKSVVESAVADLAGSGGGVVHFGAGEFDYGSQYFEGHQISNITFEGEGNGATVIKNNSSAAADTEPFNFSGAFGVIVRDLTVSAGGPFRSTSDALDFDQGNDVLVDHVKITASRSRGIVFDGKNSNWTSRDNRVQDCVISGSAVQGDGIEFLASSFNRVERCTITGVGGIGIQLNKSSTVADQPNKKSSDNVVSNNVIDQAGQDGIKIVSGDRNKIKDNTIRNSANVTSGRDGIRITAADSITCNDNSVVSNTSNDNQTPKTQRYGLNISSSLCNRTVVGPIPPNDFTPNLTAPYRDLGTGTIFQV
jgi:parallel beta-helix repeat protein